jgi:hypothetical protein
MSHSLRWGSCRNMKLTTHLYSMSRLRMRGAFSPFTMHVNGVGLRHRVRFNLTYHFYVMMAEFWLRPDTNKAVTILLSSVSGFTNMEKLIHFLLNCFGRKILFVILWIAKKVSNKNKKIPLKTVNVKKYLFVVFGLKCHTVHRLSAATRGIGVPHLSVHQRAARHAYPHTKSGC